MDVVVLGLGHIGASLAARLSGRGVRVWGWDKNPESARFCRSRGWLCGVLSSPLESGRANRSGGKRVECSVEFEHGAICVVALPESAVRDTRFCELLSTLPRYAIVTDVFSSKGRGTAELKRLCAQYGLRAAWTHPLAGREGSGVASADPTIFEEALVLIERGAPRALRSELERFWQSVGCRVEAVSTAEHQKRMARGSHLMHVLAYSLVHAFRNGAAGAGLRSVASPSVLGATRVAKSDPEAWSAILLSNSREVLAAVRGLSAELEKSSRLIKRGNGAALAKHLASAQKARLAMESVKGAKP